MAKNASQFLALLRGINVGGRNIIAKDDLRLCFEDLGFTNVSTYIQSGNILFCSTKSSVNGLTAAVEAGLSERFSCEAQAIVIPHWAYETAVAAAPDGWGTNDQQKHNVLFTLRGVTPESVLTQLPPPKTDIETVATGAGVIFWSASKSQLAKTTMMKLPKQPVYQRMTIRNHNTVFKLLELFADL